jgi:hypothetical protein
MNTDTRNRERGQGLVELVLIVPIVMLLIGGVVEFGLMANDTLTLGYGAREGARAGSALAQGGAGDCLGGDDPGGVDQTVVAAVQRIIQSDGSNVRLSDVSIKIFRADANGDEIAGSVNTWAYTGPSSGPDIDPGPGVSRLDFSPTSAPWPACARVNSGTRDILGVEVEYDRRLVTPLASVMSIFGGSSPSVMLGERTVMTLNPSV